MLLDSLLQEGKQICILLYTPFVFMLHDIFLCKQLAMTMLNIASLNMDPHICYSKSVKIMLLIDCLFVIIVLLQQGQANIHTFSGIVTYFHSSTKRLYFADFKHNVVVVNLRKIILEVPYHPRT